MVMITATVGTTFRVQVPTSVGARVIVTIVFGARL